MMRRRALLGAGVAAGLAAWAGPAHALGRTPLAGTFTMSLPWSLRSIDPHDFTDPLAALFAAAIFDTLVTHDKRGFLPGLAAVLPQREAGGTIVRLRPGLRTAAGKALDARDVVASLNRARAHGAGPVLEGLTAPIPSPKDPLAVMFVNANPSAVIRALSSPLCAIVARSFDPQQPDGTGAFAATLGAGKLVLNRNLHAAMGPSFLDALAVKESSDMRDMFRDFEVGRDHIGWLGTGLFQGRSDAEKFDLGSVGTFVLAASAKAGALAKPGALQKLVDDLPRAALGHLGLGALPAGSTSVSYDGPPIDLWVEASAHPIEIGEAIAGVLSRRDHQVVVRKGSRDEIAARRKRGEAMLSLHVLRPLGSAAAGVPLGAGLAHLDDPSRSGAAPTGASLREMARGLRVAVLGDLRVAGGKTTSFVLKPSERGGWDLGSSAVKRKGR